MIFIAATLTPTTVVIATAGAGGGVADVPIGGFTPPR
jgi:hypothetical protein